MSETMITRSDVEQYVHDTLPWTETQDWDINGIVDDMLGEWPDLIGDHPGILELGRIGRHVRNQQMVTAGADVCIAFPYGKARGTRGCMKLAKKAGISTVDMSTQREVAERRTGMSGGFLTHTRWFVPAYVAPTGSIVPIGDETVVRSDAEAQAELLKSPEDKTEIFVAFRDLPSWERWYEPW